MHPYFAMAIALSRRLYGQKVTVRSTAMKNSQNYVLVVGQPSRESPAAQTMARTLSCPVVTMPSPDRALALAKSDPPYLVILSGDDGQTWAPQVARQIRQSVHPESVVIVALTVSSAHSWRPQEEPAEIDGFFVEPLSADVLSTLNESAITKKKCLQPA